MDDNQTGGIFEQRIKTSHIHISQITTPVFTYILRQIERCRIALLLGNEIGDISHFRRIDKGTLHTHRISTLQEEHISTTYQLVSTRTVENRARVDHGGHTECDTGREVRLDGTSDDVRGRTLRGDDHMDTHGTRQLGGTRNRQFDLLTGCHNQVAELINHDYDIRHEPMSLFRIQFAVDEFLVILLDVAHMGSFQQVVAGIHLHTERVQRLHHLGHVGDDGIFAIGQFGKEMVFDHRIDAEFHFLGVDKHELQFSRMLLI